MCVRCVVVYDHIYRVNAARFVRLIVREGGENRHQNGNELWGCTSNNNNHYRIDKGWGCCSWQWVTVIIINISIGGGCARLETGADWTEKEFGQIGDPNRWAEQQVPHCCCLIKAFNSCIAAAAAAPLLLLLLLYIQFAINYKKKPRSRMCLLVCRKLLCKSRVV